MSNRIKAISEEEIDEMIKQFEAEEIDDAAWEGPFDAKSVKFTSGNLKDTIQSLLFEIDNIEVLIQLEEYIKTRKESLVKT